MSVRVVAGIYGGRRLQAPRGMTTRPTSDRVREAVFAALGGCDGARVLDLFAGSGAMGIEALSRGAVSATFVDSDARAAACVRGNLATLGIERGVARVVARDWRAAVAAEAARGATYDLCVIDPPYSLLAGISPALARALAPVLAESATVVIEGPATGPVPTLDGIGVTQRSDRSYGATRVSILRIGGTD